MDGVKIQLEEDKTDIICELCGRQMVVKTGRYGKFIACPGYPECKNIKKIINETGAECPKCFMDAKSIQTVTLFPGTNLLWKNVRSAEKPC